ncbi:MAG: microcin C ABC transporter permease YejB [Alphaproteobacteria bacterium]
MKYYLLKRLLLIPFTLFGIMLLNFVFIQLAPGGPVERVIASLEGFDDAATARLSGNASGSSETMRTGNRKMSASSSSKYRGAEGINPEFIAELEKRFGFDKPLHTRFFIMLKNYLKFDFGSSFYRDTGVIDLIISKLPVSISLGLWSTLLIYLISIPLGITKAVRDGSRFDIASSWFITIGYAVPSFLFAIFLIVLFCGGSYLQWFPLKGLTSDDWDRFSTFHKITDYFWHIALPVTAMTIGGFAGLTMLTKNSFVEEIHKQYVITARAKGLSEKRVLYCHVFRNAMLLVIAGFPSLIISMLFTGSVLIEIIFSLDGIGLLGYEAVMNRDYPIIFGTLYLFGLIGLILNLVCDLTYHLIDPRIDFSKKEVR